MLDEPELDLGGAEVRVPPFDAITFHLAELRED
jgi:hypothetical protein